MIETIEVIAENKFLEVDTIIIVNDESILVYESYSVEKALEMVQKTLSENYDLSENNLFAKLSKPSTTYHPEIERIEKEKGLDFAENMFGYHEFFFSISNRRA